MNPVVASLAASCIFAVGVATGKYLTRMGRYRRFWRIGAGKGNVVHIVAGTVDRPVLERGYRRATCAGTDMVAVGNLSAAVTLGYRKRCAVRPSVSASFHQHFWNDPVILVGGRTRNEATRTVLEKATAAGMRFPFTIDDEGPSGEPRAVVDTENNQRYEPTIRQNQMVEDYGVIYCLPSPFGQLAKHPIFIFYGLHSFGTAATSRLVEADYFKKLCRTKLSPAGSWFQVLVRVSVEGEETFPSVVSARPIDVPPNLERTRLGSVGGIWPRPKLRG